MTQTWTNQSVEQLLHDLAHDLLSPGRGECLACYAARMLDDFGCDTNLRFATYYRDTTAPAATALVGRLAQVGAFCDCEIFLNGWWLNHSFWERSQRPTSSSPVTGATEPPDPLPPCAGVRRGSTQPCDNWARRSRYAW